MPMNRNLYAVSAGNECRYPDKISVSAEFIIRNCRPRIGLGVFYMKNPDFSSRNWLGPPQQYFQKQKILDFYYLTKEKVF